MNDIETSFDRVLHATERCFHDIKLELKEELVSEVANPVWNWWLRDALQTCSTFFFKAAIGYRLINRPYNARAKFDSAFDKYRAWYNHIYTLLPEYNAVMIHEPFYDANGDCNRRDFILLLRALRKNLAGLVKAFKTSGIRCSDLRILNELLLIHFQFYVNEIFYGGVDGIACAPLIFDRIHDGCENAIFHANPALFNELLPNRP